MLKKIRNFPVIRQICDLWMQFAKALGFVMSRIVFTMIYVFAIGIYSIIWRGIKTLQKEKPADTYWLSKEDEEQTLETLRRQF